MFIELQERSHYTYWAFHFINKNCGIESYEKQAAEEVLALFFDLQFWQFVTFLRVQGFQHWITQPRTFLPAPISKQAQYIYESLIIVIKRF